MLRSCGKEHNGRAACRDPRASHDRQHRRSGRLFRGGQRSAPHHLLCLRKPGASASNADGKHVDGREPQLFQYIPRSTCSLARRSSEYLPCAVRTRRGKIQGKHAAASSAHQQHQRHWEYHYEGRAFQAVQYRRRERVRRSLTNFMNGAGSRRDLRLFLIFPGTLCSEVNCYANSCGGG